MRKMTFLLCLVLGVALGWGNLATAQAADELGEGQRLAAQGDISGALAAYQSLTEKQPDSFDAFAGLGGMQLLDQRYGDAVQSFQQAISLGDPGARSFIGMGMSYLHLGQFELARAAFIEAKSRGADNPAQIDEVVAWIDARRPGELRQHP